MMEQMKFRDKSLTIGERIKDLLERLTDDEKIDMLSSCQKGVERLGISTWHIGCEAARGFVSKDPEEISTVFPQPIGMASTFDKELMRKIGEVAGDETRYYYSKDPTGRLMLWGPTVDMERNPLWGRTEEGYGEDPCLAGEMSAEYTAGLAGSYRLDEDTGKDIRDCRTDEKGVLLKTVPTLKHFCANNNERGRMSGNSNVTVKLLLDYYYRAFKPALTEGGAHSLMTAYNKIGGVPGDMNPDVQKIAKDQWKMDFAVSDGGAFTQNVLEHRFTETHSEALALCIKNGTDTMTDNSEAVSAAAKDALEKGLITIADIDKALENVFIARFRLGEFDDSHRYSDIKVLPDSEYARSVNKRAAYEQMCLLKNNGILPLRGKKKILVSGPIADENYRDWYTGVSSYKVSVKNAFESRLADGDLIFDNGYDIVSVRSKLNGKYMSVGDSGLITFSADKITDRELFELHKWSKSVINFKSVYNKKYIAENGAYYASSETPYDWFIKEWLRPSEYGEYIYFESWHNDSVYVSENGEMKTRGSCRPSDDRLFSVEIISDGTKRIKALSDKSDIVIYCGGNHPMQVARECYDRDTLSLPCHQHKQLMSIPREKLIFMLISSYPYSITEESGYASAVLYSSHCGAELGNAVYDTVFGRNNPAARCPLTWYSSDCEIPDIRNYDIVSSKATYMYYDGKPLFPFGYGLSYSSFEYSELSVESGEKTLTARVKVKNTSSTDGDEVVQIYFRCVHEPKRILKLCGFSRISAAANETKEAVITIPLERIESFNTVTLQMTVLSGNYTFMAGASSKDIRLSQTVYIEGTECGERITGSVIYAYSFDKSQGGELDFSKEMNDRYVKFSDWGGALTFENCRFKNAKSFRILAAAPAAPAQIEIFQKESEEIICSACVPSCVSESAFTELTIPVDMQPSDGTVEIRLRGMISVYCFTALE